MKKECVFMTYALIGGGNDPDSDLAQVMSENGHHLGYYCDADRWTLQFDDNLSVTLIPGLSVSADSIRSAFNIDYIGNHLFVLSVTESDNILTVVLVKWSDTYDPSTNDVLTIKKVYGELSNMMVVHDKIKIYGYMTPRSLLLKDGPLSGTDTNLLACMNDVFFHNKLPLTVSFCSEYRTTTNKSLGHVIIDFDGNNKCHLTVSLLADSLLPSPVFANELYDSSFKLHQKLDCY